MSHEEWNQNLIYHGLVDWDCYSSCVKCVAVDMWLLVNRKKYFSSTCGCLFSRLCLCLLQFMAHTPSLLIGSIKLVKQQPASLLPQLVVTDGWAHPISRAQLTFELTWCPCSDTGVLSLWLPSICSVPSALSDLIISLILIVEAETIGISKTAALAEGSQSAVVHERNSSKLGLWEAKSCTVWSNQTKELWLQFLVIKGPTEYLDDGYNVCLLSAVFF